MNQRNLARLSGYSLLLMAIAAGFSLGFVFPKIFDPTHLDVAQPNIAQNLMDYQLMLVGLIIVLLLDVLVAWTLYEYFKNDHKLLAIGSGIFRIIYAVIFAVAIFYLAQNVGQHDNAVVIENHDKFQWFWSAGLITFGIHLLLLSVLMKLHQVIPSVMCYLMLVAGAAYVVIHFLKTVFPQHSDLTDQLNTIMGLPMALAELSLAVWLIAKGGKSIAR